MKKLLLVVIVLIGFTNWYTNENNSVFNKDGSTETTLIHEEGVFLYATDWCGYCEKTRKFLDEKNIEYHEYDIEKSAQGKQEYDEMNGNGVPLLIVNSEIIRGYNTSSIIKALNK